MEYREITADLAAEYKDFCTQELQDDPDFGEYYYYAALDGNTLAGLAVLNATPEGVELMSIGISPKYQRKGIGSEIIARLYLILQQRYEPMLNGSELFFSLKEIRDPDKWEDLDRFFKRCGFVLSERSVFIKADAGRLADFPLIKKALNKVNTEHIVSLKDIPDNALRLFNNKCANKNLFHKIDRKDYDVASSLFYVDNGIVTACILNSAPDANSYDNEWVYLSPEEDNKMVIAALIARSAEICSEKTGAEFTVLPIDDRGRMLADKIIPEQRILKEIRVYSQRINPVGEFYRSDDQYK